MLVGQNLSSNYKFERNSLSALMDDEEVVCVTGGSGFIGSWLVCLLLKKGYNVHATVENLNDANETQHLKGLPGADGRLELFQLDLLNYDSVAGAISGCQGVFHVASPCTFNSDDIQDPQAHLLDPAGLGTLNVLEASRKANVKRVVLTSCFSALIPNPNWPPKTVIDENSWTSMDFCRGNKIWYPLSKALAERAAWTFANSNKIDMVSIHPSICLGHLLQPRLNASSAVLLDVLKGSSDSRLHYWLGSVHVKDVAKAHIVLYETPTASGRYLCTNGITHFSDFTEMVVKLFPEYPIHRFSKETQPDLVRCTSASEKLTALGIQFTAIEDAINEAVSSLKDKGLLPEMLSVET
eukprot:TRINITY_DN36283_c0_g1_i1.p1 TRINITY_DN36283_c0_g1~~TRINITY_DN36283_c0_g1_i1.p1  ORF type:complete len:353 (+),score=61.20 TRINITY_DN36283_c0_g1_i1:214-1272(+)